MKTTNKIFFSVGVMLLILFQGPAMAADAKLLIAAPVEIKSGQSFVVPVKIDQVEKLAGVKLVIEYDAKFLTYEKSEKSEKTSKLMHVVNDKEPGKLIVVMAGARGISGKEMDILAIHFKAAANIKEKRVGKIQVVEIELVSEHLHQIACKLSEAVISILPEKD